MTLKSLFRPLLLALTLLPLSACSALVGPKDLTIEYDEEVKLHNGEMIWVHITRHYIEGGGKEISEMFRGGGKNVIPTQVEISWDTGFEGVGRESVFFKYFGSIDKFDKTWYLIGNINICNLKDSKYGNTGLYFDNECIEHTGTWVEEKSRGEGSTYLYTISDNGEFTKDKKVENLPKSVSYNILSVDNFYSAKQLEGKSISWKEKLSIRKDENLNPFTTPVNPNFR